jgi:hypothetical protein
MCTLIQTAMLNGVAWLADVLNTIADYTAAA